jgi:hypothetical protein
MLGFAVEVCRSNAFNIPLSASSSERSGTQVDLSSATASHPYLVQSIALVTQIMAPN